MNFVFWKCQFVWEKKTTRILLCQLTLSFFFYLYVFARWIAHSLPWHSDWILHNFFSLVVWNANYLVDLLKNFSLRMHVHTRPNLYSRVFDKNKQINKQYGRISILYPVEFVVSGTSTKIESKENMNNLDFDSSLAAESSRHQFYFNWHTTIKSFHNCIKSKPFKPWTTCYNTVTEKRKETVPVMHCG